MTFALTALALGLAALVVVGTALPLLRIDWWAVRVFDFPRLQLLALGLVAALLLPFADVAETTRVGVYALLAASLAYQALRILPYTRLWKRQVLDAPRADAPHADAPGGGARVSLLVSNVLMDNRDASRLLALVRTHDPDLVLLAEPDAWWEAAVEEIAAERPHTMRRALPNTYGLLLYSRLPFEEAREETIIEDELPSFHVVTRLGGRRVQSHFVHPKPPAPQEATDTTNRDAELLVVGKRVAKNRGMPTIVAGDLNDVAWSFSTRLFQRVSGLLDPRRGRGLYATFHAHHALLRWPLDHVFHSDHFTLAGLQRLPDMGSDHFPIFVALELTPGAEAVQEGPDADASDARVAEEKIAKAVGGASGGAS